jgi:hypothetical protein
MKMQAGSDVFLFFSFGISRELRKGKKSMHIEKSDFFAAASKMGIPKEQAEPFWELLSTQSDTGNKFNFAHIMFYLGTMIVISAMSWFLGIGWETFGGKGILIISLSYMALFIFIGNKLSQKQNLKVPGGLFITLAVCMTPLAIYGFQQMTGWWLTETPGNYKDFYSWIKGGWFTMEIATILTGTITVICYPFPFITSPIFFSLWFMSMDITPIIAGPEYTFNDLLWVSLWFGLAILVVSYFIDQRTKQDFAFWGYLFGMLSFWFGLSYMESDSELKRFGYCCINIGLVLISILLQRHIFLIFGSLGIFGYLASLFYRNFYDSTAFPFVLSALGIGIVFIGIWYQKNHQRIEDFILKALPDVVKKMLPRNRKS